jgi:hypothetical protein
MAKVVLRNKVIARMMMMMNIVALLGLSLSSLGRLVMLLSCPFEPILVKYHLAKMKSTRKLSNTEQDKVFEKVISLLEDLIVEKLVITYNSITSKHEENLDNTSAKGSNLNATTITFKSIVKYEVIGLDENFQGVCLGHVFLKLVNMLQLMKRLYLFLSSVSS